MVQFPVQSYAVIKWQSQGQSSLLSFLPPVWVSWLCATSWLQSVGLPLIPTPLLRQIYKVQEGSVCDLSGFPVDTPRVSASVPLEEGQAALKCLSLPSAGGSVVG
jgi:hypothetical protein